MDKTRIVERLREIAEPILIAYKEDLYTHDKALIEGAEPGTVLLWGPRPTGTHMIVLRRSYLPNRSAMEHYKAVQTVSPPDNWYLIRIGSVKWSILPEADTDILMQEIYDECLTAYKTISEMHL